MCTGKQPCIHTCNLKMLAPEWEQGVSQYWSTPPSHAWLAPNFQLQSVSCCSEKRSMFPAARTQLSNTITKLLFIHVSNKLLPNSLHLLGLHVERGQRPAGSIFKGAYLLRIFTA